MINVYAWPPVGVVGHEWTEEAPIQRSRSLITGKDYLSAYARKRRVVTLNVSSLAKSRSGAGYSEMLKRLLDGGINAVRLKSYPINWWLDAQQLDPFRRSEGFLEWDASTGYEFNWISQEPSVYVADKPLTWYSGEYISGYTRQFGDYYRVVCGTFNLEEGTIVARPGDFVTVYEPTEEGVVEHTTQVLKEAVVDRNGDTTLIVLDEIPELNDVRIDVGASATGVFRPVELPRSMQGLGSDWQYKWAFKEVFADEVGGFTEIDPWT